jgi:hypothetical protein
MITVEELQSLKEDDLVEAGPLFAAMTPEPIRLRVKEIMRGKKTVSGVKFVMTWCNITLGGLKATVVSNRIQWERS